MGTPTANANWTAKNPDYYSRRYQEQRSEIRASVRARMYGLTKEEFETLLESQDGRCAICGLVFTYERHGTKPMIDHDHETGIVRGLLCHTCNFRLSVIENKDFIEAAQTYLGKEV